MSGTHKTRHPIKSPRTDRKAGRKGRSQHVLADNDNSCPCDSPIIMCGNNQPGCGGFNLKNLHDQWKHLKYVMPRPEPLDTTSQDHANWLREYQTWKDLKCAGGEGYFCRNHGEWIFCGEVDELYGACPARHGSIGELEDQMNLLDVGTGMLTYADSSPYEQTAHDDNPSSYPKIQSLSMEHTEPERTWQGSYTPSSAPYAYRPGDEYYEDTGKGSSITETDQAAQYETYSGKDSGSRDVEPGPQPEPEPEPRPTMSSFYGGVYEEPSSPKTLSTSKKAPSSSRTNKNTQKHKAVIDGRARQTSSTSRNAYYTSGDAGVLDSAGPSEATFYDYTQSNSSFVSYDGYGDGEYTQEAYSEAPPTGYELKPQKPPKERRRK
ncbi:hypothetical protein B0H63DRAFT_510037 [Podospora didyma]|uniref:Uncharacterized protein n=1 Tax=Podospora didyma TaxID=330526 RepID=A0AAE0NPD9_9PEZI|nr:hypothetical protein B0H63DRAFT_510037 [Podospora didyma]